MPISNYTAQDLLGVFTGIFLFIPVLIVPGYVTGYIFDLFDFRKRQPLVRLGMGLVLSCGISPSLFFLTYRLASDIFTFIVLSGCTVVFAIILFRERDFGMLFKYIAGNKLAKATVWVAILWTFLAALMLVDIQWGNRLYFNISAYDYATRASVINAITRSGVPPINPSLYAGKPVRLTFLYYFWYVLCSLVDQVGGKVVDARMALIASVVWAGLALMATVALYLRTRNAGRPDVWRLALTGIGLLAVSGLDILGSTFYIIYPQYLVGDMINGDIEHWNEQITAWVGTTIWTPHHLISLLSCMLGWLLIVHHQNKKVSQKISSAVIAGLAFATAFGLSSWVTLIFVVFWMIWIITKLMKGDSLRNSWTLFLPGISAAIAVLPFVLDLLSGSGGNSVAAGSLLAFDIRLFQPVTIFTINLPHWERMLIHLFVLPLNYFLELGFFLLASVYWYHLCGKELLNKNPFVKGEIILLLTSSILVTFTRSTLIANNDLGWRGWLPAQFIMLIWGTDVISHVWSKQPVPRISFFHRPISVKGLKITLTILLVIGILTSLQDILLLRTWPMLIDTGRLHPPSPISYDIFLGKKVYEARTLYKLIDEQTPVDTIIQADIGSTVDRPGGLYRTRNTVIATHTLYGVAPEVFQPLLKEIGSIFETETSGWQRLDETCRHYSIDLLIIKDSDALWKSVDKLKSERQPLFMGKYYAAFYCGDK